MKDSNKFFLEIQDIRHRYSSQYDENVIQAAMEIEKLQTDQPSDNFDLSKLPFSSSFTLKTNTW